MTAVLHSVLNVTIPVCVLVAVIIAYRLIFRKAPKWINCMLWAVVGLRLAVPVPLETFAGLLPKMNIIDSGNVVNVFSSAPAAELTPSAYGTAAVSQTAASVPAFDLADTLNTLYFALWIIGFVIMLIVGAVSYVKMSRGLKASVKLKDGIYSCDYVDTAFILGIFRPKIYVPSSVDETKLDFILAHENAHLKRHDHWWKPLGYFLLAVYWFNPAVWVAYYFLCRDIELACDEKVIKNMTKEEKAGYSQALLDCNKSDKRLTVCPVAFGETGVRQRVRSALNYKKPAFWVIIIALIAGIAVSVCFGTSRASDEIPAYTGIDYYIVALDVYTQDRLVCYKVSENLELEKAGEKFTSDYSASSAKSWAEELIGESRKITALEVNDNYRIEWNVAPSEEFNRITEKGVDPFEIKSVEFTEKALFAREEKDGKTFTHIYAASDYENEKVLENEILYAAFSSIEIVGSEYDGYVSKAILDSEELSEFAEFEAEGHYIMGTEEKGDKVKIYALTSYSGFRFENGVFMDSTGFAAPAVIEVNKTTGEMKTEFPGDGTEYGKDIKRMFPLKYRGMIYCGKYSAYMGEQVVSQARAYLDSIGRTEQICNYGDVIHIFLPDVGAPENLRLPDGYPDEIGSVEAIENGERFVYETRYDKENNVIACFKHKYGSDENIEYVAYDITTGDVKSTVSYPTFSAKKLPGMIMATVHISQVVDGKTGNLAYGLRDEDAKVISNYISAIDNNDIWGYSYDNLSDVLIDIDGDGKYMYDSSSGILSDTSADRAYRFRELDRVEINRIISDYIPIPDSATEYSTVAYIDPDTGMNVMQILP